MLQMIRLTAHPSDHGFTYTLARDGVLVLTTGNRAEVTACLSALKLEIPLQLIDAAEHWGFVEIRAEPNPDWRGG